MKATLLVLLLTFMQHSNAASFLTFKCEKPDIEFTLGENSNPSKSQLLKLCNCLDSKISDKAKVINSTFKSDKSNKNVTEEDLRFFINELGNAMTSCGAQDL